MDENDLTCQHYGHCTGGDIKGVNMLNCLYHVNDVSIPIAFDLIRKPIRFIDLKTRRDKRRSEVTKNKLLRLMIDTCMKNKIKFTLALFIHGLVLLKIWSISSYNTKSSLSVP